MHTYRKCGTASWEVGFYRPGNGLFNPIGPTFGVECEAAAYASFLNGGRYCPDEIAHIFAVPVDEEADDGTYPRPQGMDYEPEAARK